MTDMVWPIAAAAAINAGSSLIGGLMGQQSAKKGLKFQKRALKRGLGLAAPYQEVGQNAMRDLATAYGLEGPSGTPNFYATSLKPGALYPGGVTQGATPGGDLAARRADFQSRFEASPIYQNVYRPALAESTAKLERMYGAQGLGRSGSILQGLAENAGRLGGNTLATYMQGLEDLYSGGAAARNQAMSGLTSAGATGAQLAGDTSLAAGVVGAGRSVSNALGDYWQYQQLQQPGGSSAYSPIRNSSYWGR